MHVCVFLCKLKEEGQEEHLFLIPQKASLPGPGGAGVSLEGCEGKKGRRGRVNGHTHTLLLLMPLSHVHFKNISIP